MALGNMADGRRSGGRGRACGRRWPTPIPLVRAHAVWAAARLGRRRPARPLAGEPDPEVRAELDGRRAVLAAAEPI